MMSKTRFIIWATMLNTLMFIALTAITFLQYLNITESVIAFAILLVIGTYLSYYSIHK